MGLLQPCNPSGLQLGWKSFSSRSQVGSRQAPPFVLSTRKVQAMAERLREKQKERLVNLRYKYTGLKKAFLNSRCADNLSHFFSRTMPTCMCFPPYHKMAQWCHANPWSLIHLKHFRLFCSFCSKSTMHQQYSSTST